MAAKSKSEDSVPSTKLDEKKVKPSEVEFHWAPHKEPETVKQRFARKTKENPLVPIGAAATVTALALGLYNFKKGDSQKQQLMMRARVVAQGFTVLAIVGGLGITILRDKNKSSEKPSK